MHKPLRFAPTLSAIALASVIAGCATPQSGVRTSFGGKDGKSKIGLAMRAMSALNANDYAGAVSFAERAVENSPNDAGFRALLGNAYFASGRFASAEAAYRDALSLYPNQPAAVLKLALVQIAQGKNAQALAFLSTVRNTLEPADYGLALALAGQPQEAVNVLESAARQVGADARVRQNLALAHALSGDWTAARNVAAQDLPADLVDARIQQWMTFAKPSAAYDQVASLTGVKPVAADPGQPNRLALHSPKAPSTRTAHAGKPARAVKAPVIVASAPRPAPKPRVARKVPAPKPSAARAVPAPQPPVAQYVPPPPLVAQYVPKPQQPIAKKVAKPPQPVALKVAAAPPAVTQYEPAPQPSVTLYEPQLQLPTAQYVAPPQPLITHYKPAPQPAFEQLAAPQLAEAIPVPASEPKPAVQARVSEPKPVIQVAIPAPEPQGVSKYIAAAAEAVAQAPVAIAEMVGITAPKARPKKPAMSALAMLHRASWARAKGNSTAVVQLGAYGSPKRVAVAWNNAARRYSALRAYSPVSARFNSTKGLVYRLSVKGFGNAGQAKALCLSLRRAGGECFVRSVAGDAPVRLASR